MNPIDTNFTAPSLIFLTTTDINADCNLTAVAFNSVFQALQVATIQVNGRMNKSECSNNFRFKKFRKASQLSCANIH